MTPEQTTPGSNCPDTNQTDVMPYTERATENLLYQILQSQKFQKALILAADATKESGYETAYRVILDTRHNPFVTRVRRGGAGSVGGMDDQSLTLSDMDGEILISPGFGLGTEYIDLHFHPDDDARPSTVDLEEVYGRGSDTDKRPAYMMVCSVSDNNKIHSLIVVAPVSSLVPEEIEAYGRSILAGDYLPQRAVENLSKIGLEAFAIDLLPQTSDGIRNYRIASKSKKVLKAHSKPILRFTRVSDDSDLQY